MSTNLTVFPLTVSSWGASPSYATDIIVGANGQEVRNANWQDPLYSYNAGFLVKTYADIAAIQTFFHAMKGREQSFLVKDYADYKVDSYTQFAETPDGTRTQFQLIKNYTESVTGTYTRNITKPKIHTVVIKDNGTTVSNANYTVSLSTGIVTFSTAPLTGHTITFICEFYVPCRFDVDTLPVEMMTYWVNEGVDKSNVNVPVIPLIEVRE